MASASDFHIVGGGINGLLLARELVSGGASVTLIERQDPGREASWAGGGIVSPLYPWRYGAPITALASWAQQSYPQLAQDLLAETGIDVELSVTGLLMLDAEDQNEALHWAAAHNTEMQRIDAEAIAKREAAIASGFSAGLWMPRIANVRNPRLLKALVASLREQPGVEFVTQSELVSIETQGEAVHSVSLRKQQSGELVREQVSHLILCAGAWSGKLLARLGDVVDVHPVKGQMLLYQFPQPPVSSIVLTAGRYLIPRRDGYLLAGSTLEYAGFDSTPSQDVRESLQRSAESLLPALETMQPVAHWAGLRPGSGDGIPYIGAVPGWSNLSVNAGQFRNGLVLAPASARLMADLLLRREPVVDPLPYDPGRLKKRA